MYAGCSCPYTQLDSISDDSHSRPLVLKPSLEVACCGHDADFQTTLFDGIQSVIFSRDSASAPKHVQGAWEQQIYCPWVIGSGMDSFKVRLVHVCICWDLDRTLNGHSEEEFEVYNTGPVVIFGSHCQARG